MLLDEDEFEPLLEPGIHDSTLDAIQDVAVTPFEDSEHRRALLTGLMRFIELLRETGVEGELWIDGSFLTTKPRPSDIDLVFVVSPTFDVARASEEQQILLRDLFVAKRDLVRLQYSCDAYIELDDMHRKSYWRGLFGFSRDEQPKGFLRVEL